MKAKFKQSLMFFEEVAVIFTLRCHGFYMDDIFWIVKSWPLLMQGEACSSFNVILALPGWVIAVLEEFWKVIYCCVEFFHLEINVLTVVQRLFSTVHTCIFWLVLLPFVTQEEMYPCIYKWSLRPEYASIFLVFNWIFFSLQHKTKFSTSSIYSNSYFNLLRLILQCRLP